MSDSPAISASLDAIHRRLDGLTERLDQPPQRFLTVDGAASYTSLSAETIRRAISKGDLVAHRPAKGRVLLDKLAVDSWVLSATATPRNGRGRARPP